MSTMLFVLLLVVMVVLLANIETSVRPGGTGCWIYPQETSAAFQPLHDVNSLLLPWRSARKLNKWTIKAKDLITAAARMKPSTKPVH